jgi:UDP-glucose 4-epimerase
VLKAIKSIWSFSSFKKNRGLINIALRKAVNKREFNVWGDGSNLKDYIYVEDVARIIFTLLNQRIKNRVLNIGSNKGYSYQ